MTDDKHKEDIKTVEKKFSLDGNIKKEYITKTSPEEFKSSQSENGDDHKGSPLQSPVVTWSYGGSQLSAAVNVTSHGSRARSLISNEQQRALKTFYSTNTRPSALELDRLAADAGLPKRVVQVRNVLRMRILVYSQPMCCHLGKSSMIEIACLTLHNVTLIKLHGQNFVCLSDLVTLKLPMSDILK